MVFLGIDRCAGPNDINAELLPQAKTCVYALCYNEETILPYFLRHYSTFCNEIVVYDNGSTDKSLKIINSAKNTRIVRYNAGELRDDLHRTMKDNIWKEARGRFDFVVVVDMDEFVFYPDMKRLLGFCKLKGKTILSPKGYEMVGDEVPTGSGMIYDYIKKGVYNKLYNKCAIFDPDAIKEIRYSPGAHRAAPRGRVRYFRSPELKMLHFRFLSKEHYLNRIKNARQSEMNRKKNYGFALDLPEEYHSKLYEDMLSKAETVI
ncbi:MAG: glycosyltransferase family 2 protein [Candidatus Margulisiibacteriota bacterium]